LKENILQTVCPPAPVVAAPPLRIGIVGLGFGQYVLKLLSQKPANEFFSVAGVCDLRQQLADSLAQSLGVTAHASLDEMIEDDQVDVIGLFTQPSNRAQLLRKIIRAGKDVLTTKPFELNAREARSVLKEAQELGRVIHLNSPAPFPTGDLRLVEQWRDEYDLGRPVGGRGAVWASYHETADGAWQDDPESCPAGPLFRIGIYLMHDLNRILGAAESVQLMTSRIRTGRPTPDNAQLQIGYRNGAMGHVFASFCVDDGDQYQSSLTLQFERGTIYRNVGGFRDDVSSEKQSAEMILVGRRQNGREILEHTRVDELAGVYLWEVLARTIHEGRTIEDSYIEEIVNGVRLIDALRRAQDGGQADV
jgi:predicted dehydrogenase